MLLVSRAPAPNHPALRRAQALAVYNEAGLETARLLLSEKLSGQANVLSEIDETAAVSVRQLETTMASAVTIDQLLAAEAQAALAYWGAWATLPVPFAPRDGRGPTALAQLRAAALAALRLAAARGESGERDPQLSVCHSRG